MKFPIVLCLTLGILALICPPVSAQIPGTDLDNCGSHASDDVIIAGCTAVLQSGHATPAVLAGAYQNRGIAYSDEYKNDQAISDYSEALSLQPPTATLYILRAIAYDNSAGPTTVDQSIADFSAAIALNPAPEDLAFAYVHRGRQYEHKLLNDKAIADYRAALSVDPRNEDAKDSLNELGVVP